ncbi:MAG: hypothetical protein ABJF23_01335 [Bryobacteraceae bacterium]
MSIRNGFLGYLLPAVVLASAGSASAFQGSPPVANADAKILADFNSRVGEYMKVRKKAGESRKLKKPVDSQASINRHQQILAHEIREEREKARQGDIFTPEIADVFRRLIAQASQGSKGVQMKQSLKHAEPVNLVLKVNRAYPEELPLQSSPPTLLANLPALPKELDFRVVGSNLILRDREANLIIDFFDQAIKKP